ncbi:ABC transporter ATP-binding protein [Streptomyces sp. B21-108]|jgi:branched-chain amino acid transport system ATP-binding protein|uniref:ABC transporter ATP-binding protein n=1 Tax=Streptomyces sp. B21-108 TaxID=3039419 RepID=UPI002FF182A9
MSATSTLTGAPALRLDALTAGYDGIPAAREVTLEVRSGEVVALLGPNGAGKTTTLAAAVGLVQTLEGTVSIHGEPVARRPVHRLAREGVSYVPEGRALFFGLTVREHMVLARSRKGASLDEILDLLPELRKCLDRRAGLLSGGEQQMLAIGRALVSRPRLLLVDELSLGLAPVIVQRLLPVLGRAAQEMGAGVLFVEQHVALALGIADRAYVMSNGRIVLTGTGAELAGRRDLLAASYLGESAVDEADGDPDGGRE